MNSPQAFDEEKYERLLGGLECSEVMVSSVIKESNTFRFDAEFFSKLAVSTEKKILKFEHFFLSEKYIVSGPFGSTLKSAAYMTKGDIAFVRIENIKQSFHINLDNMVYISNKDNERISNSQLFTDDLILSKVGNTIGCFARIDDRLKTCNISENNIGLKLSSYSIYEKHFILTYFNSIYGQILLLRRKSGNAQPKFNVNDVCFIPIPKLTYKMQKHISNIIISSDTLRYKANEKYQEAETLLLTSLNLENFTPSRQNTSVKSFSETFASGRLDAEYYQKKYDEIEEKIKSYQYGYSIVGKCFQPVKDDFDRKENSYPYIEIGDVNIGTATAEHNIIQTEDLPDNAKIKVEAGDILISKVRPNRGAVTIVKDIPNLIVSGAFCVLRSTKAYSPETLLVLLRTAIYKEWLLKWNVGTSYPVIKDKDVYNLPIPLLPEPIQQQISAKVKESFALREQSKQLLKAATRAVEIAIEEGEAAAFKYLEAQIL